VAAESEEEMSDTVSITQIQSYVHHGGKAWFVSTIERDSSAAVIPSPRYNETIVWEWNPVTRERGEMLTTFEDRKNSIAMHQRVCASLYYFAGDTKRVSEDGQEELLK
jgi:hypothetical protein